MATTLPIGPRSRPDVYEMVMERFAPCIVGATQFRKRRKTLPVNEEQMWTTSDEAFLFLVIENAYARWVDLIKRKHVNALDPTQSIESEVKTEYTFEGGMTREGRFKGWSAEGVLRFNVIYDLVSKDRKQYETAYHQWTKANQPHKPYIKQGRGRARELGNIGVHTDSFWDHVGARTIEEPDNPADLFPEVINNVDEPDFLVGI